jgi:hypothetical protein
MSITSGLLDFSLRAKQEVYEIIQYGQTITIRKPATMDELGEPLTWSTKDFKAFPIKYSPFGRDTKNKFAYIENVNVVATISYQEMQNSSMTVEDMRSYTELVIDGKTYSIKHVQEYGHIKDTYLYVHIGAI